MALSFHFVIVHCLWYSMLYTICYLYIHIIDNLQLIWHNNHSLLFIDIQHLRGDIKSIQTHILAFVTSYIWQTANSSIFHYRLTLWFIYSTFSKIFIAKIGCSREELANFKWDQFYIFIFFSSVNEKLLWLFVNVFSNDSEFHRWKE